MQLWVAALAALATLAARLAVGGRAIPLGPTDGAFQQGRSRSSFLFRSDLPRLDARLSSARHQWHGDAPARNQAQNLALGRQLSDGEQSGIEATLSQGSDGQPQKEQAAGQCGRAGL